MSPTQLTLTSQAPNIKPRFPATKRGRKLAHSCGKKTKFVPRIQRLTNEKFMSASQKRAHRAGEEIWV